MRFLEDRRTYKSRRIEKAFLANYRRFMDIDVHDFPCPTNTQDLATSAPYAQDISNIRSAPTRRNQRKRTRRSNNENDIYEYNDANDEEYI